MHKDIPVLEEDYIRSRHFAFPKQSSSQVGSAYWVIKRSIHSRLIYVKRNT